MDIINRIEKAREIIRGTKIKKQGRNNYSNYDYFTPEQIESLVSAACKQAGIITVFNLQADDHGLYGETIVYQAGEESGQFIPDSGYKTIMRTVMPEIKATNAAQQMGGCMTYTRRYMLMSLFGIVENALDFDSQDNRPKQAAKPKKQVPSDKAIQSLVERVKAEGKGVIAKAMEAFELTEAQILMLNKL